MLKCDKADALNVLSASLRSEDPRTGHSAEGLKTIVAELLSTIKGVRICIGLTPNMQPIPREFQLLVMCADHTVAI